ncbi:MAG: hypothetical protein Q8O75_04105 [bacterium]|nr:hypothetical protein [bacterium]
MAQINVYSLSGDPQAAPQKFQVEVADEDDTKTTHNVTLSPELYQRLTGGLRSGEELVRASFEFLLERESKSEILQSFDLSQIQKYFPEYEAVISSQLAR